MKFRKILLGGLAFLIGSGFGIRNVYASPSVTAETLPDTVTRGDIQWAFASGTNQQSGKSNYPFYNLSADGKYMLYCSDRNNAVYQSGDILKKGEKLPYGIAYILTNNFPQRNQVDGVVGKQFDSTGTSTDITSSIPNDMINIWVTQLSIWGYQGTFSSADIRNESLFYRSGLGTDLSENSNNLYLNGTEVNSLNFWKEYVEKTIAEAKAAQDPDTATIEFSKDIKWTKGDDVTKSSLISVISNSEDFSNFALSLEDAPEGTKVYKEDGTEINLSTGGFYANEKFYITVPNNKISSGEAKFKLMSNSDIDYPVAYQYAADNGHQPSVLVGYDTKKIETAVDLTITPDTASTISRAIYFLGFIILISGVAIIYANIQPNKKSEV